MRGLILMALAVFAMPAQARAPTDEAAITKIVRSVYAAYETKGDANIKPPRPTARLAAVEKQCAATAQLLDKAEPDASYGHCANDYDVYCQCQDWIGIDFPNMDIKVTIAGDSADATLRFSGEGPDLRLMFKRDKKGWALDDLWEFNRLESDDGTTDEPSYRKRLAGEIDAMRATLKLPAWTPPTS